ncbi:hypothetical protein L1283_003422 [Sphingobacterium sp. HSC-15S19]
MLYRRDIKRCYDLKTFILKVFTELDEKLMRSIDLEQ